MSITIVNTDGKVTFQNDKNIAYFVVGASFNNKIIKCDMSKSLQKKTVFQNVNSQLSGVPFPTICSV